MAATLNASIRSLRIGSKGRDVAVLQQFLIGQNIPFGLADGTYGPKTAKAVAVYQARHHLNADGIAGQRTLGHMIGRGLALVSDTELDVPAPPADMRPLVSNEARQRRWGRFAYRAAPLSGNPENIEITDDWEDRHIVTITCPVFAKKVRLHRQVTDDYIAAMQEVIQLGKKELLLTHEGAFVPRFIRGSRVTLSNHAWGTAFDVNYNWNQLGHMPAYIGQRGSVRDLVPIFARHNFYWGGWFRARRDGMHFEHVG